MTVGELISRLESISRDFQVAIHQYNQGYGGLFSVTDIEVKEVSDDGLGNVSGTVVELST